MAWRFRRDQYPAAARMYDEYVCAVCWGPLALVADGDGLVLRCARHPEHEGFVTRAFAERRRAESAAELAEAQNNLAEALGLERPSAEDALRALGFDD